MKLFYVYETKFSKTRIFHIESKIGVLPNNQITDAQYINPQAILIKNRLSVGKITLALISIQRIDREMISFLNRNWQS